MTPNGKHRVPAPDALRARGLFEGVTDDEIIDEWLTLVEKASGANLGGDERNIMQTTIKELIRGVIPLGELDSEASHLVDSEVSTRLQEVGKEIGARVVWNNLPEMGTGLQAPTPLAQAEGTE